jgi:hypothetical protein
MASAAVSELTGLRPGAQNASTACAIALSPEAADTVPGRDAVSSGS